MWLPSSDNLHEPCERFRPLVFHGPIMFHVSTFPSLPVNSCEFSSCSVRFCEIFFVSLRSHKWHVAKSSNIRKLSAGFRQIFFLCIRMTHSERSGDLPHPYSYCFARWHTLTMLTWPARNPPMTLPRAEMESCVFTVRRFWDLGISVDLRWSTRWCPPSYKLVYNPINYRYIYHKSQWN